MSDFNLSLDELLRTNPGFWRGVYSLASTLLNDYSMDNEKEVTTLELSAYIESILEQGTQNDYLEQDKDSALLIDEYPSSFIQEIFRYIATNWQEILGIDTGIEYPEET
jgi:hypothetical protein